MPRDLSSQQNSITFKDAISGENIRLFYRSPLPSDIQAYASASITRKGGKVIFNSVDPKLKYGSEILTGIREGDFIFEKKPLSSDTASPNYREDWKSIIKDKAPDLIILLAAQVFDGSHIVEMESDAGEATEDAVPFTTKS